MAGAERTELPAEVNALTSRIIRAAMAEHTELGPGLYEKVYRRAVEHELRQMGIAVATEHPVPVTYRGELIDEEGYRVDLLVEDTVIVELKSVIALSPVHKKQLLTYLRLTEKPVGLLVNFNVEHLREGISRVINPRRNAATKGDT